MMCEAFKTTLLHNMAVSKIMKVIKRMVSMGTWSTEDLHGLFLVEAPEDSRE